MKRTRSGRIFDFHCHIFPDKIAVKASSATGSYYGVPMCHDGTVSTLLAASAAAGVTDCLVCSAATRPEQVRSINDYIAAEAGAHPAFIGFGSLHPYMEGLADEVDRMIRIGVRGVKLHADFQHFRLDDPRAYALYEAVEGRLPLLLHMGDRNTENTTPEQLADIVRRFPRLDVVGAHFGGYSVWERAARVLPDTGVHVDTSSCLGFLTPERGTELVRAFGAERCFFGTDYPMWDHTEELARFDQLGLDESERNAVLWENAAAFFGLGPKD